MKKKYFQGRGAAAIGGLVLTFCLSFNGQNVYGQEVIEPSMALSNDVPQAVVNASETGQSGEDASAEVSEPLEKDLSSIVRCRDSQDEMSVFGEGETEPDSKLLSDLGIEKDKFSETALSRVRSFSEDKALDYLLSIYRAFSLSRNASGMLENSELLELLDAENDLDVRDRVAVMQTVLPMLIDYAISEGEASIVRKYRLKLQSYERLWPGARLRIVCQNDDRAVSWGVEAMASGQKLDVKGAEPRLPLCGEEGGVEASDALQSAISCYVVHATEKIAFSDEGMEKALLSALSALISKDNQLCAMEVMHLTEMLSRLRRQNSETANSGALNEKWLCQLHVISLLLLEQHRFVELMRLEREIQATWGDSGFVKRLGAKCEKKLDRSFAETYSRLENDYGNAYAWVKKQFEPKNFKKLDKNFRVWTKKGTANVKFLRRLIVLWALWSEGKYKKAAAIGGDVTEGKSRLGHPQLHSLNIILKAASGEEISQEALETYVRVIELKSPWLAYQTLSEAGRMFSVAQRRMAVDVMRKYTPADASREAALFYREYEQELRASMNSQHLSEIDAWLETELRVVESPEEANRRRLVWLNDLIAAENWLKISELSKLSVEDSPSEVWRDFWTTVNCHAREASECAKISEMGAIDCDLSEESASRSSWFGAVAECLQKQK